MGIEFTCNDGAAFEIVGEHDVAGSHFLFCDPVVGRDFMSDGHFEVLLLVLLIGLFLK